jgi:hypothetical protein
LPLSMLFHGGNGGSITLWGELEDEFVPPGKLRGKNLPFLFFGG